MERLLNVYVSEEKTQEGKPYLKYSFRKLDKNGDYEYFRIVFKRNKDKPDTKGMYTIKVDENNLSILPKNNKYKNRGIYIKEIISCELKMLSNEEKQIIHDKQMKELFD